ncbi:MAG: hypothetical protein MUE44_28960 [Oscillatoriaceae cyanobacterium Prado104]|nr:hypothetical protein [Oscillatoriaceae cyanobacterium Prado104]
MKPRERAIELGNFGRSGSPIRTRKSARNNGLFIEYQKLIFVRALIC